LNAITANEFLESLVQRIPKTGSAETHQSLLPLALKLSPSKKYPPVS
jgi:hypothetical protein